MSGMPTTTLDEELARVAGVSNLLVATDFDGTIAPFVLDPRQARALPGALTALTALAGMPDTAAALVSGRDIDSLGAASGIAVDGDGAIVLIASHGAQCSLPTTDDVDDDERDAAGRRSPDASVAHRRDVLRTRLEAIAEQCPGAHVEVKAAGLALHTRAVSTDLAAQAAVALAAAEALGRAEPDVRVIAGSAVVELALSTADKGTALTALAARLGAQAVVYLGDDTTDEDAFAALDTIRDLTIKVGDGPTHARFRVADPAAATAVIVRLAALRS